MAVPKRRTSKAKRDQRKAHWKLKVPGMVSCKKCHALTVPHRVCTSCGNYNGRQVINV